MKLKFSYLTILLIYLSAILIPSFSVLSGTANAFNIPFYSSNGIHYYDDEDCPPIPSSTTQIENNSTENSESTDTPVDERDGATPGEQATADNTDSASELSENVKYGPKIGNIPAEGMTVNASIYGGEYKSDKWIIDNIVQAHMIRVQKSITEDSMKATLSENAKNIPESELRKIYDNPGSQDKRSPASIRVDDNGYGRKNNPLHNTVSFAELNNQLGNIPDGTKLEISYNGKSVIAEKLDIGGGGGNGAKLDLWWETARMLDFKDGKADIKIRPVDASTPLTKVSDRAGIGDQANNTQQCCAIGTTAVDNATVASIDANGNLETILRILTAKGLTLAQASGIAGNMQQESGWDPTAVQYTTKKATSDYIPKHGTGFGLIQWTTGGRQSSLVKYAKSQNKPIIDLTMQVEYVLVEMTRDYKSTLSALTKETDPAKAAYIVHGRTNEIKSDPRFSSLPVPGFEASADSPSGVEKRGNNAKAIYEKYKGKIQDGNGVSGADNSSASGFPTVASSSCVSDSGTGGGTGTMVGDKAQASFIAKDGFVVFFQCDPRWGSIPISRGGGGDTTHLCRSGCGPVSFAMIANALNGKFMDMKEYAKMVSGMGIIIGGGGVHNMATKLAPKFGLKAKKLNSIQGVNDTLKAGGMVHICGVGGEPYSPNGHFVAIRKLLPNGKWLVADSSGTRQKENNNKEWDPNQVWSLTYKDCVYGITK